MLKYLPSLLKIVPYVLVRRCPSGWDALSEITSTNSPTLLGLLSHIGFSLSLCFSNYFLSQPIRVFTFSSHSRLHLCLSIFLAYAALNLTFSLLLGGGAAIAQWISLRLPSCRPGFESQSHHLCFYQIRFELWHIEKMKINKKRPELAHLKNFLYIMFKFFLFLFITIIKNSVPLFSQSSLLPPRSSFTATISCFVRLIFYAVCLWEIFSAYLLLNHYVEWNSNSWHRYGNI